MSLESGTLVITLPSVSILFSEAQLAPGINRAFQKPRCHNLPSFVHLSICPSIHPSIHPPIHPFIHPLIHSSIHLSMHSSIHPSIHPPTHPSTHPSVHLLIHQALYI